MEHTPLDQPSGTAADAPGRTDDNGPYRIGAPLAALMVAACTLAMAAMVLSDAHDRTVWAAHEDLAATVADTLTHQAADGIDHTDIAAIEEQGAVTVGRPAEWLPLVVDAVDRIPLFDVGPTRLQAAPQPIVEAGTVQSLVVDVGGSCVWAAFVDGETTVDRGRCDDGVRAVRAQADEHELAGMTAALPDGLDRSGLVTRVSASSLAYPDSVVVDRLDGAAVVTYENVDTGECVAFVREDVGQAREVRWYERDGSCLPRQAAHRGGRLLSAEAGRARR